MNALSCTRYGTRLFAMALHEEESYFLRACSVISHSVVVDVLVRQVTRGVNFLRPPLAVCVFRPSELELYAASCSPQTWRHGCEAAPGKPPEESLALLPPVDSPRGEAVGLRVNRLPV